MVIKKIEFTLRKEANLGPWQVISPGSQSAIGYVEFVKDLKEVQFKVYEKKTILLTEVVGGNEEIPVNVVGLVIINSRDYPDILAHVSVRSRNLGVLFSVCFDDKECSDLLGLRNKWIELKLLKYDQFEFKLAKEIVATKEEVSKNHVQSVEIKEDFPNIYLELDEFCKDYVGAKSNNTKKIFNKLPDWIYFPESFAIPFNVQEYFMSLTSNAKINERIEKIYEELDEIDLSKSESNTKIIQKLSEARDLIMKLNWEENEKTELLKKRLIDFGVKKHEFDLSFNAMKSVFASRYNERVFISLHKIGLKIKHIRMAVLIQKIIPADFAFVIHTKNPLNNDSSEIYAEVVHGMGETLVGFFEGQSFSFSVKKGNFPMI